jgi:hypothetical protein
VLTKACEQCKTSIDAHKGRLLVKEAARAVRSLPHPEQLGVLLLSVQNDRAAHCRGYRLRSLKGQLPHAAGDRAG